MKHTNVYGWAVELLGVPIYFTGQIHVFSCGVPCDGANELFIPEADSTFRQNEGNVTPTVEGTVAQYSSCDPLSMWIVYNFMQIINDCHINNGH